MSMVTQKVLPQTHPGWPRMTTTPFLGILVHLHRATELAIKGHIRDPRDLRLGNGSELIAESDEILLRGRRTTFS